MVHLDHGIGQCARAVEGQPARRVPRDPAHPQIEVRRGDPEPEPDRLALKRELWLDFGGDSYSVSDHISGTMSRGWRINASAGLVPGQVTLDGKPMKYNAKADILNPYFVVIGAADRDWLALLPDCE